MVVDPSEAARPEGGKRVEVTGAERESAELGRRAETLGDELRSFEKDAAEADRMLEKMKDPAKREEFRSALGALRGRASGAGNALRGVVAGLALFAGGVGVGKGMSDGRREAAVVDLARQAGAADAENRMLKAELAKKDEAPRVAGEKRDDRALDVLAQENASSRKENAELRKQAEALMAEVRQMREQRDEAEKRVLAEKEKGIGTQEALMKQQAVTANMGALFDKMNVLIGQSSDKKLQEELRRFLEAYQ